MIVLLKQLGLLMEKPLNILFLEGFYSGSHRYFLDMITDYSTHHITTILLPEMGWRGNFNCSPLRIYQDIGDITQYHMVIASSLVDIASLKGLYTEFPPVIYYFHENQFAYPNQKYRYEALKNIHAAIACDGLIFNSQFHRGQFRESMTAYIKQVVPHFSSSELLDKIDQSAIIYPGFDHRRIIHQKPGMNKIPIILWNHRWSQDKNYELFFRWLKQLRHDSVPFKFYFLGEGLPNTPPPFDRFEKLFAQECAHFGFLDSREQYYQALGASDIIISCAFEENFGISVMEGIASGATPLLPDRLSYQELIPKAYHDQLLYQNDRDGYLKLKNRLVNGDFFDGVSLTTPHRGDQIVQQLDQYFIDQFKHINKGSSL